MPSTLSRDQKRKQKLTKRASHPRPSLASELKKYRAPRYVPALLQAELGIRKADAIFGNTLVDREVEEAVRKLVGEVRAASERPTAAEELVATGVDETVAWGIKSGWTDLLDDGWPYGNADLAGVLEVVLDSIDTWSRSGRGPRAYLDFLELFLEAAGFAIEFAPSAEETGEDE